MDWYQKNDCSLGLSHLWHISHLCLLFVLCCVLVFIPYVHTCGLLRRSAQGSPPPRGLYLLTWAWKRMYLFVYVGAQRMYVGVIDLFLCSRRCFFIVWCRSVFVNMLLVVKNMDIHFFPKHCKYLSLDFVRIFLRHALMLPHTRNI